MYKKIMALTKDKNFGIGVIYYPQTKLYAFNLKNPIYYTEEEIEQIYLEGFLCGNKLNTQKSIIGRIKERSNNSSVGLNRIRDLSRVFDRITRETGNKKHKREDSFRN